MTFHEKEAHLRTPINAWKKTLGDAAKIIGGGTPSTKESSYWNGTIPWITPKDLSLQRGKYIEQGDRNITEIGMANSNAKPIPANSVVLSTRAPIGYLAITKKQITTNQGCHSLIPYYDTDCEFLYYLLKANVEFLKLQSNGSTFGELSAKALKELAFSLPELIEQKAIAKILSDLDSKIELNQKMNKTLEAIAQAIFKHWFIDFEYPNEEGKPYRSSGGEMVDSELGEIPKDWQFRTLNQIAEVKIGRTPPTAQKKWFSNNENDIPWISIKDLRDANTFVLDTARYLTQEAVNNFNIPIIKTGTVVLSFKLTVGRVAITDMECTSNEAIAQFKILNKSFPNWFLYLYLKQYDFNQVISTSSIATATNSKEVGKIPIIVPQSYILLRETTTFELIFNMINLNTLENKKLIKIRDSLLPKLMSGKIRVPLEE